MGSGDRLVVTVAVGNDARWRWTLVARETNLVELTVEILRKKSFKSEWGTKFREPNPTRDLAGTFIFGFSGHGFARLSVFFISYYTVKFGSLVF